MVDEMATDKHVSYVVLERVEIEPVEIEGPADAPLVEVWMPVRDADDQGPRVFKASGKVAAIRQYLAEGDADRPGAWKAIAWSSWKGGEQNKETKRMERLPLDDDSDEGEGT